MILTEVLHNRLDLILFILLSFLLMLAMHSIRKYRGSSKGMPAGLWIVWAVLMIGTAVLSEKSGQDEKAQIISMLEGFAPTYAQEMEKMGHDKITIRTGSGDETYLRLIEAEKRWLKMNPIVSDIYTIGRGENGEAVLLVDSETDYNHNGKFDEEREQRTKIGEPFPQQNTRFQKALEGNVVFETTPYSDRWGTWVTVHYPIRDAQGKAYAVLAVDYDARTWVSAILLNRLSVFGFSFMAVLILVGYGLADSILRSRDRYFRALIENGLDIVTVLDSEGLVMYESPSIFTVLGYRDTELNGKRAFDYIHQDDVPAVMETFAKIRETGECHSVKFRFRHKDGSWRYLESRAMDFVGDPDVRGVIVNSRDISENVKAQHDLEMQRLTSLQHSKMASLGEMASGIAHEVNTPLGVIIGKIEQLRRFLAQPQGNSADAASHVDSIQEMVMRIAKIIRSLRSFSRNASEDPFSRALLPHIIEDAVSICSERFKNHGIRLSVAQIPGIPVECRPAEITQVLLNLLSNAFDAVEAQSRDKWVSIEAVQDDNDVKILIADSGPGISPDVMERIFEPFFTTKPVGKGTGLGLSICRGIVEAHGGRISVSGHAGDNRFCVTLPKFHGTKKAA